MQKIKRLPPNEAKKIAAGEVVERPANVVKELIENSIDASAKNITIYLELSGKKLIRVIDNGCGMSEEDALLCFEHHATSKINSVDDLNSIATLGFRGEGLSSISSISKVKLVTKEKDTQEGAYLYLEDGEIKEQKQISCSTGTDIEICDIFYNVPARLKFLKKDESELRQIIQLFQAFCLSYQNIHFKLFHDNKLVYNCPEVQNLRSRIVQLWDHNFEQNMNELDLNDEKTKIKIFGLISNYNVERFNRSQIFFFVNGRWVKNQNLSKALLKGYSNVLSKDKFPVAFIFILSPSDLVDINVHPRKEEVQFIQPKRIENLIQEATVKSLENQLSKKLENKIDFSPKEIQNSTQSKFFAATQTTFDFEQLPSFEPIDQINNELETISFSEIKRNIVNIDQFLEQKTESSRVFIEKKQDENFKIIGQFNNCYILLEREDGLFIIDQHAAHERILYENFSKKFNDIAKVKLIFPIIITLTEANLEILLPYFEFLKNYGIEAEPFSKDQLTIHSIPVHLKDLKLDELIKQLISWIEEYQDLDKAEFFKLINEKLCAQMACKSAVKSGDKLSFEQMSQLLQDLQKTENRFVCPHGRPTSWTLSLNEIEKKFKRNYK